MENKLLIGRCSKCAHIYTEERMPYKNECHECGSRVITRLLEDNKENREFVDTIKTERGEIK